MDPTAPDLRVTLKKDNTFIIRRGFSNLTRNTDKNAPSSVPEKIMGTLYTDRIVVEKIEYVSPNADLISSLLGRKYPMVFKFYNFEQMPKTRKPYLVYKEGSLWD